MMDDVLISQLPPNLLRSALRVLVSQGPMIQKSFVEHIRKRLLENSKPVPEASKLFPEKNEVSCCAKQYISYMRCLISCKLIQEALSCLTHFVKSIRASTVQWSNGSELETTLDAVSGDVVQALQALKETFPNPTEELLILLQHLLKSLRGYGTNSPEKNLSRPFGRAELQIVDFLDSLNPSQDCAQATTESLDVTIDPTVADQIEYTSLGTWHVPRLFNGLWQLSSPAWGSASLEKQFFGLSHVVSRGFVAADMADHYGDAELVYGSFRNAISVSSTKGRVIAATKWCVFKSIALGPKETSYTVALRAVQERSRRLGGIVDLLQFHWYDYSDKAYLSILSSLLQVAEDYPSLIRAVGLCNFDSTNLEEACNHLLVSTGKVGIVSNQVQFSIIDTRPLHTMTAVCSKYNIKLLTYGTFLGGLLSERWLHTPQPDPYSPQTLLTPSQRKYLDMINCWGSWSEFQDLLGVLTRIAEKHDVSLTNVATRWVLEQENVGAIIVGTRLGVSEHAAENLRVFGFTLAQNERRAIDQVALGRDGERTRKLWERIGDCGDEYRGTR